MRLVQREDTGPFSHDDPGEPTTGLPRIGVTKEEAELLAFLAAKKYVFEIGTGLGTSAAAMASTANEVSTIDIDPWVHENVFPTLRETFAIKCYTDWDGPPTEVDYNMVFIDGEHTDAALRADITTADLMLGRHGVIVVHDAIEMRGTLHQLGGWTTIPTRYGIGIKYVGWNY